jgi:putative endonuclease
MTRHWSESVARTHVERLGYQVLAQNHTLRGGEIDLIAQDGATLVFIEVKQRTTSRYGTPAEAITARKLERLRRAALHYMVTRYRRDDLPLRFDAILVHGTETYFRLEHLKDVA